MKPRTITLDFEVYGLKGQSRKSRKSAGREILNALFDLLTHHQTNIMAIMGCQCTKSGEDARKFEDFAYFCGVFMLLSSKDIVI